MTRRRSSPLGLELVLSVVLALVVLPLLSHGAPVQESHDLQKYSEGCYYNYNHYSEGDRILTNEPCLNCTCHNKMLMCYLRVCPFTKPIGHDCTVEKREDQCCPIVTCPEVPVDIAHHSHQLTTSAPGTELSIPEKYGCSIDNKFYVEGAQVPSNPNKPCELCYCIRNRTSCLMQECTLHIDGCQPIYNKGSCCPVRYNCDHENELLEIEDFSTTTTTIRPTEGYLLPSTTSPSVTTDCVHNNEVYADGASITGKNSCEHCYCMRGDIVCAVQECEMPTLESGAKTCRALPPAAGECCPSNYVCDDDSSVTTEGGLMTEDIATTITPIVQSNLHDSVSQEDVQLQEHIDDKIAVTELPSEDTEEQTVQSGQKDEIVPTTSLPIAGDVAEPSEEEEVEDKVSEVEEEEKPHLTSTISAIKETSFETTQSPIEHSTTHKTEEVEEEGIESSHKDKEDQSTQAPIEDEIINVEKEEEEDSTKDTTTVSPVVGDIQSTEDEEVSSPVEKTTASSIVDEDHKEEDEVTSVPSKENEDKPVEDESTASTVEITKPESQPEDVLATTLGSVEESEDMDKKSVTEASPSGETALQTSMPSKTDIKPEETLPEEDSEKADVTTALPELESENVSSSTLAPVKESEDVESTSVDSQSDSSTSAPSKENIKPEETSSESGDFSEESTPSQGGEIQDKIDEDVSEPSSAIPSSSPTYEMITEGDNGDISMPEIGDHKTESDLPKKKPKDELESVEDMNIPSDVTKDELPQGSSDATTVYPASDKLDEETSSSKPSEESIEDKLTTVKPKSDETTQATTEDKPVLEEDEIPAVVEEITGTSSKPISGDISDEIDTSSQTTALPIEDEVKESQDEKDEQLYTEAAITEKQKTTTGRPIRIHIADEEEESAEITTKATEKDESSTSVHSDVDSIPSVTEKEEDMEISTSSSPTAIDSEKPSVEDVQIKDEQDTTVKSPSSADESEDAKPEKESEESSTPEDEVSESVTIATLGSKAPETEDKESEDKPETDVGDSTTAIPSVDESEEPHFGEGQDVVQPEHKIELTTIAPEADISEEEQKKKPEQTLTDSTTKQPEDEESIAEEDVTKSKPVYDATEKPAVIESEPTSVEEDSEKQKPEETIDSTTISSESKPEIPSIEEDVKPELGASDQITTVSPAVSESEVSSAEEAVTKTPEDQNSKATTVSSVSAEDKISEKEPSVEETAATVSEKEPTIEEIATTVSSVEDSPVVTQQSEIEKQPEQGISEATTSVPTILDESETSQKEEEEHKEKPTISEGETSSSDDSTTVAPSVDISDEEVKKDEVSGDLTTVSSITSDEEIKKQPEQGIEDSATKTPETLTASDEEIKIQQQTTIKPLLDTGSSITEKEDIPSEEDLSTRAPSTATDTQPGLVSDEKEDSTTSVPSKEIVEEQETIDLQTTASPIEHTDKESSEPIDTSEGDSGIPLHDIIPAAIPGEGDCLANGKTFSNNASIPTASECELSCTCVNSIVVCQRVPCYEPPTPNNCVLDEASTDKCCPQYICGIDSFAPGQGPTTPEEIEDGEIQFTTLAPTKKYPEISTESVELTQKPEIEDEPISQTESSKTEIPATSDESTTPSSVYFEQPIVTPQEPMSHVKADEAEEPSTEQAGEDISAEDSTTTKQPITAKPTKQVTGDIEEEPIEVTSSIPEYGASSKKPEAIDEEDQTATAAPTHEEHPSTSGPVDKKPEEEIVAEEDQTATAAPTHEEHPSSSGPVDKKPEEEIIAEEDQTATAAPTHEEHPSTSGPVDKKPEEEIIAGEETVTKSPISMDVSETAAVTEDNLEKDVTTVQPIKSEPSTEAPSVPAVTQTDDSAQSEETPEISEESSNESGEETDSEEITKFPIKEVDEEKEEVEKTTTTKPLVSEHVGDIEPIDESTNIPEIDMGKPEMPEDLSHTKVEDEVASPPHKEEATKPIEESEDAGEKISTTTSSTIKEKPSKPIDSGESEEDQGSEEAIEKVSTTTASTIKEKPIKPTDSEESEENQESEEAIDKIITTPATTVLTRVEPIEDDLHKVEISDKKDDEITSSESPEQQEPIEDHLAPHEDKPISSTIKPEEESDSETATETKKDTIDSQTSSPVPVSGDEYQTISPVVDEEKPIIPTKEDEDKEDITPSTSIPSIEENIIEGSGADISEEDKQDKKTDVVSSTITPIADQTLAPVSSDDNVHIPSHTSVPESDDHTPRADDEQDIKKDEIPSQTSAPTIEEQSTERSEDKADIEEDKVTSQTSVPDLEEDNKNDVTSATPVEDGSGAPITDSKPSVGEEEIVSQTSAPVIDATISPTVEEDSVEGSGSPISEDKTDVEKGELPTIQPATSDSDEEIKIDVTTSTPVEEGSGAPVSEDKPEDQDEIISQTSAPAVDKPISPTEEEEDSVEGSGAPVSEDKPTVEQDEIVSQTSAPAVDTPISPIEGSGAPVSEDKPEDQDEIISQTSAPAVDKPISPIEEEDSVEGSGAPVSEDKPTVEQEEIVSQTSAPAVSPIEEEDSVEGSGAPVAEDKPSVDQDEIISQTSAPAVDTPISPTEEEHSVEGSGAPISEAKPGVEQDEIVSQTTSAPAIEKLPSTSQPEEEDKIDVTSSPTSEDLPSSEEDIANKEKPESQTTAPISEEELITLSPVSEDESSSIVPSTVAPILAPNQTKSPIAIVPSSEEEGTDEEQTSSTLVPVSGLDVKPTTEKAPHEDETTSAEEEIVSGTVASNAEDKYEETELPEDKTPSVLIEENEVEIDFTTLSTVTKAPAGSIPTKEIEASEDNVDVTEAPSKESSGEDNLGATESSATSVPVKTIDEDKEITEEDATSSTDIPTKIIDEEGDSLDTTKLPSSSTPSAATESIDEATKQPQTSDESSSVEGDAVSSVTVSSSTSDEEVIPQTEAPSKSDVVPSDEKLPIAHTDEDSSDEEQHTDKTLLPTETAVPVSGTESPSVGSEIEDSDSEDKLGQTVTKKPELVSEESSTKPSKDESESSDATVMPETISSHETMPHQSKPESDDQILIEDVATVKPLSDVIPDQTESSVDEKKPSQTTQTPAVVDKTESDEKPESVEEESTEDNDSKTPKPAVEPSVSSEEDVSSEDNKPEDIKPIAQTESPSTETVEKEISSSKPIEDQTEKIAPATESEEEEEISTGKPAEEIIPTKSDEQDVVKVSSTVASVDEQPTTLSSIDVHPDSEQSSSTDKSEEEEKEHTEAPKEDNKVQTVGEFVTERAEDATTALPIVIEDKESIPEQPISPQLPETVTSLPEDEEKEKPEAPVVTEAPASEETEDQTQVPEVPPQVVVAEDAKPEVQSSTEESEEKTQAPEITSDISEEDHKPLVPETSSESSDEKTPAPETQTEITEEDHKQHVQPTEGAIASSSTDKPIVPTIEDKIDSDIPKPIDTDEQPISEEQETPLPTTVHPLFPHIEHDRTTSAPNQLNATDKIDHKIPELPSSAPTTEQPTTSQAITNAPTSHYQPPGYGQVPPAYPSYAEDEYTDEDETEVFGPGTCRYGGKLFVSAQQIPRDDPCDFCFCFRSDIICLQQSCPPPISGCHEEPISGFCCPRYECPVSMATTLNITTSTTTTSTTLPPHFLHHAYRGAAAKNGCHISGKSYKVGDKIDSASGPCMHCTCGGDGQMKCDPKTCSPEPMLRQMIAVVASRRR